MKSPGPYFGEAVLVVLIELLLFASGCGGGGSTTPPPPVNNPVPTITSLSPASAIAGAATQTLTINGTNFLSSSEVTYNGAAHTATFVNSTQLTISLSGADQATAGTYPVVLANPAPGGGTSNSVNFTVNNPVPSISSLSPASLAAGSAPQTLVINGSGFVQTSTATYDGAGHTVTFTNSSMLEIQLTASDLATAGNYPVIVTNPSPGGGASNAVNFTVGPATALTINITGLPSGTNGNVTVAGPSGYSQTLTQTTTLTALTPGAYTVTAAIVSPSSPGTLYIPTVTGSPATIASGTTVTANVSYGALSTTWTPIGPDAIEFGSSPVTGAGKLQAFAILNSNPSTMYAGGGIGPGNSGPYTEAGVYKTTNGGSTWSQVDTGLTDPTVNALWLDQSNPNVVLAGTNLAGIFQSTNGGGTWNQTGALGSTSAFIQVSGTIYAATAQGIAISTDDGGSWTVSQSTSVPVRTLASVGGVTYAGLDNGGVIIQSSPGGSWTAPVYPSGNTSRTVWSMAVNPTNSQNIFVVEWYNYTPDIYTTTNAGSTWTTIASPSGCYNGAVQAVAFDPTTGVLYAGCDGSLSKSSDGGQTWAQLPGAGGAPGDVRMLLAAAGGVSGKLVVGSDQGLYLTANVGTTWQTLNGNITSSILFGVAAAGNTVLDPAQDYSPIYSFNGGSTWQVGGFGAETGTILVNPQNAQYVYALTLAGLQVSQDGGHTFTIVSGTSYSACADNGQLIAVDPSLPSTVYAATSGGVYQSTDWGVTWNMESSWPSNPIMVAVDPNNGNKLFVGTGCGGTVSLAYTTDNGSTWNTSNLGGAGGEPTSLAVSPSNSQVVLLGLSTPGPNEILRSTDGGANFSPAISGISITRQTQCQTAAVPHIEFDPSGTGIVAAATNTGLYLSTDLGTNWTNVRGTAVPFAFTEPSWSGGYIYASTCGEGVLRMPFPF